MHALLIHEIMQAKLFSGCVFKTFKVHSKLLFDNKHYSADHVGLCMYSPANAFTDLVVPVLQCQQS